MPPNAETPFYSIPFTGEHVPEDKDQLIVKTPYGRGLVVRTRPASNSLTMREVRLLDWEQSKGSEPANPSRKNGPRRPATLFSTDDLSSVPAKTGDQVLTQFGRGTVVAVRSHDGFLEVLISSWRLAGRSRVTCYLSPSSVQVVRDKILFEMSTVERVEFAQKLKVEASKQFGARDYQKALETYARAVDAVRYVQHRSDSTNEVRADLLVVMITCCNNAGTCCIKLQQWEEAFKYAKNAVLLLDALEPKKGMKIHKILNRESFTDIKLFGVWRIKSLLIMARSLYEQNEFASPAIEILKQAHDVIRKFAEDQLHSKDETTKDSLKQLMANDKEIKRLHCQCKEQKKSILKKEKQRAQAMFAPTVSKGGHVSPESNKAVSGVPSKETPTVTEQAPHENNASSNTLDTTEQSQNTMKRSVSFTKEAIALKEKPRRKVERRSKSLDNTWYNDAEVLTGIAAFTSTVILTMAGLSYILSRKR